MLVIYGIQHNQTKRIYVGETTNTKRISTHFANLKRGTHVNEEMQKDYNLYGDDFSVYLLEIVPKGTLDDREAYWMRYFNTSDPSVGYNSQDIKAKKMDISEFPFFVPNFEFEVEQKRKSTSKEEHQFWRKIRKKSVGNIAPKSDSYIRYATFRDERGLRDIDVARECKISTSTLSDWKAGRYRPNAEKLLKISQLLNVSFTDILME